MPTPSIQQQLLKFRVIKTLRDIASHYQQSNRLHDSEQGNTLIAIADDVGSGNIDKAALRFDSLHPNVKSRLPFHVAEYLNKAEFSV